MANKTIVHILYSGLGGHGSDLFSLVKGDRLKEFPNHAIFCGIEELKEEYAAGCTKLGMGFTAIKKKRGADFRSYLAMYRAIRKAKPGTVLVYGLSFLPVALLYRLFHPGVRLITRDTQAHHLKSLSEKKLLRLAFRFSDAVVLLSPGSLEFLRPDLSTKAISKAVVIPNAIDTDLYAPSQRNSLSGETRIGMQSRLQAIKDHPTLINAFALALKKFPEQALSLQIAGDGPTAGPLRLQVQQMQLESKVIFHGMLDEQGLTRFMNGLDIYVHATFGEMMSTSIMQAMACGLPIIASDVWGVNNMIKDLENGLLYISKDQEDLVRKITLLLGDLQLRARLGNNAREFAVREFSVVQMFTRYKKLYGN